MVDMDIDAAPSAPSTPAAPKEETRPNGSHPTSSLAAIKTKVAPVRAEAPTSTAKREGAGYDVPGRPEVKVELLVRVRDAHMLADGKYALQQQQQKKAKKKKKKAKGKKGEEVEEDLAAAKPRDEGADGPIVVVRLDCDPHGLPSEKEANDKTLNSLSWCWKNHFIPKREFDPLFAPSLGKNAGAAGTPGGSPSKPPSSRKECRDQSPREKGGRDKQDPRDHHAAGGYGNDLGLDVASLSKLPLDDVVKGRDHARRLCDAMWHASGLEPRMLGTKRFAFVGEQRAIRKAREEAKEREHQRQKALAAQKKRQQRTQAAQKEKAAVGAAKAKDAAGGADPKTPKGKDKERKGAHPSDKSQGANAKARAQEAEREGHPSGDKDRGKATPLLSSKTKPEAKAKAKSKSSPTQAMDVDLGRSPGGAKQREDSSAGANGQAKAEDHSKGGEPKSKSSRAKERELRDKGPGGRKGKDKESRESDQGGLGRKDLRSAKKDKADGDKSPGGPARKETRERSSARVERRRSGDPPLASAGQVQAGSSSGPEALASATPSRPTRAAAPRAGSLKDTYASPSKQVAKQGGQGQGQGKLASQVSPKTPKHKDKASAKENAAGEANRETPAGEEWGDRLARPGLRERPETTTPSPLRERRTGRDPSAHRDPPGAPSSELKPLPLSPIMTAAASDPSLHTPLNQVQGGGLKPGGGEMNDEQLAMLLHQELNAPSSRRRRRDQSSDLLFSPNSPSKKSRKTD